MSVFLLELEIFKEQDLDMEVSSKSICRRPNSINRRIFNPTSRNVKECILHFSTFLNPFIDKESRINAISFAKELLLKLLNLETNPSLFF